jgi:excisionase family DNA binding protein
MTEKTKLDGLPDVMTVPEAAAALRLGRNGAYDAIRRGEIPAIRIGRRLLVPKLGLLRLLDTPLTDGRS